MKLKREFFERDTLVVAEELLGKVIVRKQSNGIIKGRIVETEAYIGDIDKACHAYGGKMTKRVQPLYGKPGIAYVYLIYGMYHCVNVISKKEGKPEGVLIRAIEPLEGIDLISLNRFNKEIDALTSYQKKNIANGPGKVAMALNLTKEDTFLDMCDSDLIYFEDDSYNEFEIIKAKRIGIDYAEEAKDFLWRFYIKDNICISKK